MDWIPALDDIRTDMAQVFEHLHAHPEVSWEEHQTTSWLAEQLRQLDVRVTSYEDGTGTGVVGEWGPTSGPAVGLRSDIDALWQEVDGEWRANHSCGHDAHMTIVLGATRLLRAALPNPTRRIRVIFQPAEETGEGAFCMVDRGAVDHVTQLFGVHLRPVQELSYGQFSAAIHNGAACAMHGVITGQAAHGARPHLGINPIEVAFAVMQSVAAVHINPMIPHSAKMTMLQAGGKSANVIPESAEFSFDFRAQTNEALDHLVHEAERRIAAACAVYGATVTLHRGARTIAAMVGEGAHQQLAQAITSWRGEDILAPDVVTPGAEDFHCYTASRPHLDATMLGVGCDLEPGLHHPRMTFRREAMYDAMAILAEVVYQSAQ